MNPSPQLNILLLVSNPLDAPVQIDRDVAAIEDALAQLDTSATIVTAIAEAETVGSLLARGDRSPFQILHFLGHGYQPSDPNSGQLCFESKSGMAREIDALTLAALLNPNGTPEFAVAILSACYSQSLLSALLMAGIRRMVVIDYETPVLEYAAVLFCSRFYQALLTGSTLEAAFLAGRNALISDEMLAGGVGLQEAAKFKLLPEDGDHQVRLLDRGRGDGSQESGVQMVTLPRLRRPYFGERPKHFVGRNNDLATLLGMLAENRGVLIKGISGVGKSELAREAAHWLVARQRVAPQAVAFVPLLPAQNAGDARRAIAAALGLRLELPDDPELADSELVAALPRRALLILDEAENLIALGGVAVRRSFDRLLQAPSRPLIIVTSQSDFGSSHFRLLALERLTPRAAVELFWQSVQPERQQPLFQAEESQLLAILEAVDRIPRAIVLTAGVWNYSHSNSVNSLLADLQNQREQVMADPRYPDEVKSVTVGIQLAFERLRQREPAAATLFLQLTLFAAGIPEAGVKAIFGEEAAPLLARIEDQSLVERPFADLLYVPAPLRFYGERQFSTGLATARQQIGDAVLRFYYDLPEDPHRGWINQLNNALTEAGDAMGRVIARYLAELPSIEEWLRWGYAHESASQGSSRSAGLTALLQNIYVVSNELHNRRDFFESALHTALAVADRASEANVLQALGDLELRVANLDAARQRYLAALDLYPKLGARLGEANVLQALGDLELRVANLDAARQRYLAALDLYPKLGDRLGEANVQKALGDLELRVDNLDAARQRYLAALDLYPKLGDRLGEANVLQALGDLELRVANLDAARQRYLAALDLYPKLGDRLGEANVQKALGDLELRVDNLDAARQRYLAALDLYPKLGARLGEANVLQALGDLELRVANLDAARQRYLAALDLYPKLGARLGEANVQKALGDLELRVANLDAARQRYLAALDLYPKLGARLGEANVQKALGDLELRVDNLDAARQRYLAALDLYPKLGARLGEANVQKALGDLELRVDNLDAARQRYLAALDLYPKLGARLGEANVLRRYGHLLLALEDFDDAHDKYSRSLTICRQISDRMGEAYAQRALGDIALERNALLEARHCYELALDLFWQIQDVLGAANSLLSMGKCLVEEKRYSEAVKYIQQAIQIYEEIEVSDGKADGLILLGRAVGDEHFFSESIKLNQQIENQSGIAEAFYYWGLANLAKGDLTHAENKLGQAYNLWHKIGYEKKAQRAMNALG